MKVLVVFVLVATVFYGSVTALARKASVASLQTAIDRIRVVEAELK